MSHWVLWPRATEVVYSLRSLGSPGSGLSCFGAGGTSRGRNELPWRTQWQAVVGRRLPGYSEDIDLVQTQPGSIGAVMDASHDALDPWLGKPRWKQSDGRVTFSYRFESEDLPPVALKLKVEINSREHFTVYGLRRHCFEVDSRWFHGAADIPTYELDELLGTKLRALYQRKKGRDLFDLDHALRRGEVSVARMLEVFTRYLEASDAKVTRAMFEQNLLTKRGDALFTSDLSPLLATGNHWNFDTAFERVLHELVSLLPGESWKGL